MIARSIRLRFIVSTAVWLGLALVLSGVVLSQIFERQLELRVAEEVESFWNEVASVFAVDEDGAPVLARDLADPRYRRPYGGLYFQVLAPGGVLLRSRSLWDAEIADAITLARQPDGALVRIVGPDRRPLYLLARTVRLEVGGQPTPYRISVAIERATIDEMRASFVADVRLALLLIGVLLLAASWILLGIGLRPLSAMRAELDRIRQGRAERLQGPFVRELAPLATDLNGLLDRQEEMIRKARDRSGTLAHGLKTPMTIMAAEARKLEKLDLAEIASTLREQIRLMDRHVQRELSRSRTHGPAVGGVNLADVDRTVTRLIDLCRRMPRGAGLTWERSIPAGLVLRMEADDFGEVVGNLLDNARKWAATRVTVGAAVLADGVRLEVIDDGPGFAEGIAGVATDRGIRGADTPDGSGLGLSIVRDVLADYGSRLEIGRDDAGRTVIACQLQGWLDAGPDEAGPPVADPADARGPGRAEA